MERYELEIIEAINKALAKRDKKTVTATEAGLDKKESIKAMKFILKARGVDID